MTRVPTLLVATILLVGTRVVHADGPTSQPAMAELNARALAGVTAAAQKLGEMNDDECKAFAVDVVDVLRKDGIAVADSVGRLSRPKSVVRPVRTEKEEEQICEVIELGIVQSWSKLPSPLGPDLMLLTAKAAPVPFERLVAARMIQEWFGGEKRSGELLTPESLPKVVTATRAAIFGALDSVAEAKGQLTKAQRGSLWGPVLAGACQTYFGASMMTPGATEASLSATLAELIDKLTAVRKSISDAPAQVELDKTIKMIAGMKPQLAAALKIETERKELRALVSEFMLAVSKNDRQAAAKLVTPNKVAMISAAKSLPAELFGNPDIVEVRFQDVGHTSHAGPRVYILATVVLLDANGNAKQSSIELPVTKTEQGWRIGEPDSGSY